VTTTVAYENAKVILQKALTEIYNVMGRYKQDAEISDDAHHLLLDIMEDENIIVADEFIDTSMEVALTALSRPAMRNTILEDLDINDNYAAALLKFLKSQREK